ncbi:ABC-2 transporter permease [Bacillus sp. 1NLA3E]|uniref:ABC-2 transporter permease n=1 Tax=Bacillus sp. 1NLA3E TaxID=666686 RepID=UPI000247F468|nr:ABC-2 transporter permease [Bacillus sp. 1NLA3E]AGK53784.1 ABC transporter permease [Bacillus sp. 1NLA3E]
MLHLMIKDIFTQKKVAYFAPIFLLPYFLTIGKNISGYSLITILIYSLSIAFIAYFMVMYSNFNTNESEKSQNRLLLSLPLTRRAVINAKYVMISAWWLISFLSYVVLFFVLKVMFHLYSSQTFDWRIIVLSLCFTYLLATTFYPIHFKFGYRVASIIGIGTFFLVTNGMGKLFSQNSHITPAIYEHPMVSISSITSVFVLISYFFSVRIFEKIDL